MDCWAARAGKGSARKTISFAIESSRTRRRMSSSFEVEAMVRGFHVYKDIWNASLGEYLQCIREFGNPQDIYAVAVLKSGGSTSNHSLLHQSLDCSIKCGL